MLGRRVARKTLLAVAGLVSVHDTTWTTDREGATQRWSVIDPPLSAPWSTSLLGARDTCSPPGPRYTRP
jgi:hypothetical protein